MGQKEGVAVRREAYCNCWPQHAAHAQYTKNSVARRQPRLRAEAQEETAREAKKTSLQAAVRVIRVLEKRGHGPTFNETQGGTPPAGHNSRAGPLPRRAPPAPHLLVLDLDESIQNHGSTVVRVNRVRLHIRLLVLQIHAKAAQSKTRIVKRFRNMVAFVGMLGKRGVLALVAVGKSAGRRSASQTSESANRATAVCTNVFVLHRTGACACAWCRASSRYRGYFRGLE